MPDLPFLRGVQDGIPFVMGVPYKSVWISQVLSDIYIIWMSEDEGKQKRPEFVNGVRVKAPEDYDFNTWGSSGSSQERTFRSIPRNSNCAPTQCGRRRN